MLLVAMLFFVVLIYTCSQTYATTENKGAKFTDSIDSDDTNTIDTNAGDANAGVTNADDANAGDTNTGGAGTNAAGTNSADANATGTNDSNADTVNKSATKKIRIGLFFKDRSRSLNTEVPYFDIFAEKGLEIGCSDGKKFESLIAVNCNNVVRVRKDSYFVSKDNTLIEYDPSSDIKNIPDIPDGKKIGPFHVEINGSYTDYENAKSEADKITEKGVNAYPVYNNGLWYIWIGFYTDEKSALEDIDKTIGKELGNRDYRVITPNRNNIVVVSEIGEVLAICTTDYGDFQIHPNNTNEPYIFNINGKNYRGIVEVRRLEHSDMTVINVLPIEQYLYGVVPCEIGWEAHPEALKAQAVAARTYTYNNLGKYLKTGFDLCSTVNSQVYKGYDFERKATNSAVDDTKGKVIYYNGVIAKVFYFSSSGGMTESVKNVWSSDIPYLQSVEDKYEAGNSHNYNWEKSLTAADINNIITSQGNAIGDILSINILKTSEAGRAIEVVITGRREEIVLEKARSRDFFGLPSQWYNITTDSDISAWDNNKKSTIKIHPSGKKVITGEGLKTINTNAKVFLLSADKNMVEFNGAPTMFIFTGKGYGHAVGMSQEGSKGMASAGFNFEEILLHYFTGTYIE